MKVREILLVDDDDADNFIHKRAIDKTGLAESVSVATSVDDAIAELRERDGDAPDLVLLDVNMPRKDGWDFLEEFDALPSERRANTVIVMLTSSTNEADRKRAVAFDQVGDYQVKPLTPAGLQDLVDRLRT